MKVGNTGRWRDAGEHAPWFYDNHFGEDCKTPSRLCSKPTSRFFGSRGENRLLKSPQSIAFIVCDPAPEKLHFCPMLLWNHGSV